MLWNPPLELPQMEPRELLASYEPELEAAADVLPAALGTLR
jgi:hypothetical protein